MTGLQISKRKEKLGIWCQILYSQNWPSQNFNLSFSVFSFLYGKKSVFHFSILCTVRWGYHERLLKIQRFKDLEDGVRIILRYFDYFSDELGGRKTIFEFLKKINKIFQKKNGFFFIIFICYLFG